MSRPPLLTRRGLALDQKIFPKNKQCIKKGRVKDS
jgi:hypothetical protein